MDISMTSRGSMDLGSLSRRLNIEKEPLRLRYVVFAQSQSDHVVGQRVWGLYTTLTSVMMALLLVKRHNHCACSSWAAMVWTAPFHHIFSLTCMNLLLKTPSHKTCNFNVVPELLCTLQIHPLMLHLFEKPPWDFQGPWSILQPEEYWKPPS